MKLLNIGVGGKVNLISTHRAFRPFGVTEPLSKILRCFDYLESYILRILSILGFLSP